MIFQEFVKWKKNLEKERLEKLLSSEGKIGKFCISFRHVFLF